MNKRVGQGVNLARGVRRRLQGTHPLAVALATSAACSHSFASEVRVVGLEVKVVGCSTGTETALEQALMLEVPSLGIELSRRPKIGEPKLELSLGCAGRSLSTVYYGEGGEVISEQVTMGGVVESTLVRAIALRTSEFLRRVSAPRQAPDGQLAPVSEARSSNVPEEQLSPLFTETVCTPPCATSNGAPARAEVAPTEATHSIATDIPAGMTPSTPRLRPNHPRSAPPIGRVARADAHPPAPAPAQPSEPRSHWRIGASYYVLTSSFATTLAIGGKLGPLEVGLGWSGSFAPGATNAALRALTLSTSIVEASIPFLLVTYDKLQFRLRPSIGAGFSLAVASLTAEAGSVGDVGGYGQATGGVELSFHPSETWKLDAAISGGYSLGSEQLINGTVVGGLAGPLTHIFAGISL